MKGSTKKFYLVASKNEANDKKYAYVITIRKGENAADILKAHAPEIAHICETKKEAAEIADRWNEIFKAHNVYALDIPEAEKDHNLRVCARCLAGIESREGAQVVRPIYIDEDDPQLCEWCESDASDILYEFI